MGGDVDARYNLGSCEKDAGVKHWMIAAGAGHDDSSKAIRQGVLERHATKDDFEKALRAHKYDTVDEIKSDQRDTAEAVKAAASLV